MLSERNLDRRVIVEIVNYFFSVGVDEMSMDMTVEDGTLIAHVAGLVRAKEDVDIIYLNRMLNTGRKAEVEGYYAQLIGIDQTDNDLALLGDLVDGGEAEWKDGVLNIRVWRHG